MGQTVKLRRSAISGKIPINSQLQLGELSMNTTDGKIFLSKSGSSGPSVEEVIITNTQNFGNIDLVGDLTATNISSSFIGDGSGLYNIPAAGVTGLSLDRIANSTSTASIDADGLHINTDTTVTGSLTATEFTGSGLGLTNVPIKISGSDAGSTSIDSTFTRIKFDDSTGIKISGTTGGDAVVYLSGVASESDGGEGKTEKLEVTSATSTWTLNHNLNEKHPSIEVFDSNDEVIIPQKIEATSVNQVVVSFASPQTGTVTATVGGGLPTIDSGYENRVLSVGNDGIATWKTGILSGSIDFSTLVDTGSFNTYTSSNNNTNSDQNGRLDSLEGFTSSIDDTYATDSDVTTLRTDLNTYSSSTDGRLDSLEVTSGSHDGRLDSIESKTGSFLVSNDLSTIEGKIGSLETTSGSHDDRIDRIETSTSSLNSFTSSINTTIKGKLNNDGVISGSIQIDHDATTNYVGNEHIDHSSITIGSGKGLTGGGTIDTNRSLTLDTGSVHFLSGIKSKLNTETVVSGSEQINITETTNYNLVDGRLDSIESFTSSIDDTYATDDDVTTLRGDLNTYTSSNDTLNSTQDGRLDSLESNSGSYLTEYNDEYTTGATFGTSNGIVTFTRNDGDQYTVDLDGRYLTSFTETDPIFTAHAVYDITSTQIGNWDTAYGWGDHSQEGYLTTYNNEYTTGATFNGSNGIITFTRNDGDTYTLNISSTLTDINVTGGTYNDSTQTLRLNKSNGTSIDVTGFAVDTVLHTTGATFNSSDGVVTFTKNGGDTYTVDLDGRYLTSFTETDPIFTASPSAGITDTNISNWDSSYTYSTVGHLPLSGGTITGDVRFLDDDQLRLGNGNDLRLWHNGTNSYVFNYGGSMFIGTRTNDTTFLGHDGNNGDTTYFKIDGTNQGLYYYKSQFFADGVKSHYGANNDLEIYHDGSNSYITEKGTGNLNIKGGQGLALLSSSDEFYFYGDTDGQVNLYHNGLKKFETTSGGIEVSGTIVATGYNDGNWNTAYGWGDHSTVGYITGFTNTNEFTTGATFNSGNGVVTFTRNNGGDTFTVDLDGRYLTSFAETDPIFTASPSAGITETNISNWDTAYGWGDHSQEGYLTSYNDEYTTGATFNGGNGIVTFTRNDGDTYTVDLSATLSEITITGGTYNDSTQTLTLTKSDGNTVDVSGFAIESDVNYYLTGATFNTTNGVITYKVKGSSDVTVDIDGRYLTSYSETDTLDSVTDRGNTTTNNITVGKLTSTWGEFTTTDATNPGADDLNVSGYGIQGNRTSNPIYLHNYGNGGIRLGVNTTLGDGTNGVLITDTTSTFYTNVSVTGTLSASGYNDSNWNTAYGWGDHSLEGYLTSYNNEYTTGATFNGGNGIITFTRNDGDQYTVDISSTLTDINVTGGTYNDANQTLTLNKSNGSSVDVTGFAVDTVLHTTGATFNTGNGVITFTKNGGATYTVDIDGKYAESGHNHDSAYVNVDGDTMTGTLDVHVPDAGIILSSGNSSATGTPINSSLNTLMVVLQLGTLEVI